MTKSNHIQDDLNSTFLLILTGVIIAMGLPYFDSILSKLIIVLIGLIEMSFDNRLILIITYRGITFLVIITVLIAIYYNPKILFYLNSNSLKYFKIIRLGFIGFMILSLLVTFLVKDAYDKTIIDFAQDPNYYEGKLIYLKGTVYVSGELIRIILLIFYFLQISKIKKIHTANKK